MKRRNSNSTFSDDSVNFSAECSSIITAFEKEKQEEQFLTLLSQAREIGN